MAEFSGWAGLVIGALKWIFGWFGGLSGAVKAAVSLLGRQIMALGNVIAVALAKVGMAFKTLAVLLYRFWDRVVRPAFDRFYKFIREVSDRLRHWLGPIVDYLKLLRANIMRIYEHWVRPILDAIDIARRFLHVAAELGADWARELEIKLAQIEGKIEQPFLELVQAINVITGWIDRIIDLNGLFQKITLLNSLFAYKRDIINFSIRSISRPLTPYEDATYRMPYAVKEPEDHIQEMKHLLIDGYGPLEPKSREWGADLVRLIRDAA